MLQNVASGFAGTRPINPGVLTGRAASVPSDGNALDQMLTDIDRAVRTTTQPDPQRVALALAPYLSDPDLLRGKLCPCDKTRYTRHLLGEGDGYCVLGIAWYPGQMSPVHAHKTWCALGVHRGWLVESYFDVVNGTARPTGCRPCPIGAVSHAAADATAIHRIANVGVTDALSIHVYGAQYDRLGADVNLVLAD